MTENYKIIKLYKEKIQELLKFNKAYFEKDNPIISDFEFDELKKELFQLVKKHPFLKKIENLDGLIGFKPSNKFEKIKHLRSNNLPTLPTNLEEELKSNIFLRCDQNDLKIKLNMKNQEDFKVFKKVRDLKDSF